MLLKQIQLLSDSHREGNFPSDIKAYANELFLQSDCFVTQCGVTCFHICHHANLNVWRGRATLNISIMVF